MTTALSTANHRSDIVGLTYVYPVLSRRAGGLSIGINFNVNNACNWRCIYCQVPGLTLGSAPRLDFSLLERELRGFLDDVLCGDFYQRFRVDTDKRVIKDIAIAGNGEPTSLADFAEAVDLIGRIATELNVFPTAKFVLITNGSLIHQARVQQGLNHLHRYGGEVWFKFDRATDAGRATINHAGQSLRAALNNLKISSRLCKTKLQTCLFWYDGQGWSESDKHAYLETLAQVRQTTEVKHVALYTLARPSAQPEAPLLEKWPASDLEALAAEVRALGFEVSVSA